MGDFDTLADAGVSNSRVCRRNRRQLANGEERSGNARTFLRAAADSGSTGRDHRCSVYVADWSNAVATSGILSVKQPRTADPIEARDVRLRGRMVARFCYHRLRLATYRVVIVHGQNKVGLKRLEHAEATCNDRTSFL